MPSPKKKGQNRGGSRPGAGRKVVDPKKKLVAISVTLSPAVIKKLEKATKKEGINRSKLIEALVNDYL